ncbi:hypothetical protein [Pseudoalteromonas luteoviolacea]|uniref:hypothetical protein n=1 Tax=Pseudoalteromonas luteoviolacea TaxID=43657 RepID=UPI001B35877F|nr:hypothetical protein [Pseudoalteromonas luteoviolacea]MBQ4834948.1 hypothetical protein [Pseudoalteromonas luteoviolacea]
MFQYIFENYPAVPFRTFQVIMTVTLFYFIYEIKRHDVSMFYDKSRELKSDDDKDLVSWGITFCVVYIMQFIDNPMHIAIIGLDMDYILRRRLFYLLKICTGLVIFFAIYALHALRGCSFSQATRFIYYIYLLLITVHFLQFILRGYMETNILSPLYRANASLCYLYLTITILTLPISRLYRRWYTARKKVD